MTALRMSARGGESCRNRASDLQTEAARGKRKKSANVEIMNCSHNKHKVHPAAMSSDSARGGRLRHCRRVTLHLTTATGTEVLLSEQ
ncbi:hypothetical protein BaRGS_00007035, partial [Batillaria attramentaria]